MCKHIGLITLNVIKDYGKASEIYDHGYFNDTVRVIELTEDSFDVCRTLDLSIAAASRHRNGYSLPFCCILASSKEEIVSGCNVFTILPVQNHSKRKYVLIFERIYHNKKRDREEGELLIEYELKSLREEVSDLRDQIRNLRKELDEIKRYSRNNT